MESLEVDNRPPTRLHHSKWSTEHTAKLRCRSAVHIHRPKTPHLRVSASPSSYRQADRGIREGWHSTTANRGVQWCGHTTRDAEGSSTIGRDWVQSEGTPTGCGDDRGVSDEK